MAVAGVYLRGSLVDGLATPAAVVSYLALPGTSTLDQLGSALGVWAAAVDGVVDTAFTQVTATLTPALPTGLKAPTGGTWAASRVEQTGIIDFSATGTNRRWGFDLAGLSNSVIVNGKIDLTNAAIVALIDLLLNPTGFFTNPQKQSLEAALEALISFRKYSQLRARSAQPQ